MSECTCGVLLFSELLKFLLHVCILELRVIVAADVGGVSVSHGRRGAVTVHRHSVSAPRVRALLALAPARTPQEGHRPLHEVTSTVLGQGVSRGCRASWSEGDAAAVLVPRVGAQVVAMGRRVDGLRPRDVARGDVGTGGGRGLVEVWWRRVAVTAGRLGYSCTPIVFCSRRRRAARSLTGLALRRLVGPG